MRLKAGGLIMVGKTNLPEIGQYFDDRQKGSFRTARSIIAGVARASMCFPLCTIERRWKAEPDWCTIN